MDLTNKAVVQGRLFEFRKLVNKHQKAHTKYEQPFPRIEQLKQTCLARTIGYIWETPSKAEAIPRSRVHWGQHPAYLCTRLGPIAIFQHPTRINTSYKSNANV